VSESVAEFVIVFPDIDIPVPAVSVIAPASPPIEITPVLLYKNGELAGKTFKVQGEKVQANNKVITQSGGNISEKVSFVYKDDMKLSQLVLRSKIIINKKEYKLADYKIADGVITTSQLVDINGGMVALGKDELLFQLQPPLDHFAKLQKKYTNLQHLILKALLKMDNLLEYLYLYIP